MAPVQIINAGKMHSLVQMPTKLIIALMVIIYQIMNVYNALVF